MSEETEATWYKRFMQKHYTYRDYHSVQTTPLTELQVLTLAMADLAAGRTSTTQLYVFGTNARLTVNPYTLAVSGGSFPYGLTAYPQNCYAREVLVMCDQNAWVKIVSLNPEYLRQATLQTLTNVAPTAPQLIFEREQYLPAGDYLRFNPTYGYAVVFRADSIAGTINLWIEANNEGGE